MTIDEAIRHCEKVAMQNDNAAELFRQKKEASRFLVKAEAEYAENECRKCASEHRQLAEWLTELKEAKRLLKSAVEDLNATVAEVYNGGIICECCKWKSQIGECCCPDDSGCDTDYRWRYADEAKKLLNE